MDKVEIPTNTRVRTHKSHRNTKNNLNMNTVDDFLQVPFFWLHRQRPYKLNESHFIFFCFFFLCTLFHWFEFFITWEWRANGAQHYILVGYEINVKTMPKVLCLSWKSVWLSWKLKNFQIFTSNSNICWRTHSFNFECTLKCVEHPEHWILAIFVRLRFLPLLSVIAILSSFLNDNGSRLAIRQQQVQKSA